MPEGVEVKLSADLIRPLIKNGIIKQIEFPSTSRYHINHPEGIEEFKKYFSFQENVCKILDVQVKGKFMYWTIANDWYVFVTFGMSGQLSPHKGKHVCMSVTLENAPGNFYFNDPRHFGTIKFVHGKKILENKLQELGWDPLAMPLDTNLRWLTNQVLKARKPIGEILMDQKVFAGVGNYVRAEMLYLSKLSPFRLSNTLTSDEIQKLCRAAIDVMEESYKYQGATIHTYKTAFGEEGKYSSCFKVYGQKKDPLGNPIVKQESGGRTIHWCPTIQT